MPWLVHITQWCMIQTLRYRNGEPQTHSNDSVTHTALCVRGQADECQRLLCIQN
uniref:Uncharacterized protein n=1 Tax=Anguilla anguilla TaxID=7936 RepID=A0A0E9WRR5_ANGAN